MSKSIPEAKKKMFQSFQYQGTSKELAIIPAITDIVQPVAWHCVCSY